MSMCVLCHHVVHVYNRGSSDIRDLEVQIHFSLQDNREYILDNPNMIRGVWAGNKCTYKMLTYMQL